MGIFQTVQSVGNAIVETVRGRKRAKPDYVSPPSTGEPPGPYAGYGGFGQGWGPGGFRVNPNLPGARKDWYSAAGDLWRNSVVAACLGWMQDNGPSAVLETKIVKDTDEGWEEEPDPSHGLLQLLGPYGSPNKSYSQRAFWQSIYLSYKVDGNAFIIPARGAGGFGDPVELWWEPHWNVTPWRDINSPRLVDKYFIWRPNGRYIVDADEIIHLRDGIDPHNPMMGLSRLKSQCRNISGMNDAETYTAALVGNMGGIGVVWLPADGTDVDPKEARGEVNRIKRGTRGENSGNIIGLTLPGRIERVAMGPQEMALESILDRPEATICATIGVQAMSVGLAVGASQRTFSNIKEADRMSWMNGLIPMQDAILEDFGRQLLPMFADSAPIAMSCGSIAQISTRSSETPVTRRKRRSRSVTRRDRHAMNEARHGQPAAGQEGGDMTMAEEKQEAQEQFEAAQAAQMGGGAPDAGAGYEEDEYDDDAYFDEDDEEQDDIVKASVQARRDRSKRKAAQRQAAHGATGHAGPHRQGKFDTHKHPHGQHGQFARTGGSGPKPASQRAKAKTGGKKSPPKINKARRAKAANPHALVGTKGKTGGPEQANATKNEKTLAAAVGGKHAGIRQFTRAEGSPSGPAGSKYTGPNLAVDALKRDGDLRIGLEAKTMMNGKKTAITAHKDAIERKVNYAIRRPNRRVDTVVFDDRKTYNNGAEKANYSGHDLYYRRGFEGYSLSKMYKVRDHAELKQLVLMKDHELPEAARAGAKWQAWTAKGPSGDKARAKLHEDAVDEHASRLSKNLNRKARLRAEARGEGKAIMGYSLKLSSDGIKPAYYYLGSGQDIVDLGKWVATLPEDIYPDLKALCDEGETLDTEALQDQIEHALDEWPPDTDGVQVLAQTIATSIEVGNEDETASFDDGANGDDEDDEDEDEDDEDEELDAKAIVDLNEIYGDDNAAKAWAINRRRKKRKRKHHAGHHHGQGHYDTSKHPHDAQGHFARTTGGATHHAPAHAAGNGHAPTAVPKPKAAAAPKMTAEQAHAHMQHLHKNFRTMTHEGIHTHVHEMSSLSKGDVEAIAKDYRVEPLSSKKKTLDALADQASRLLTTHNRTRF